MIECLYDNTCSQKVHGILHFTYFSRRGNEGSALLLVQGNPTDRDLHLIFECLICTFLKAFLKIPRCFSAVRTISFQEAEK